MTLSVREAAELIGISRPKMYELIHSHEIPSIHIGKKITISRKALMDWLSEGETNAPSGSGCADVYDESNSHRRESRAEVDRRHAVQLDV